MAISTLTRERPTISGVAASLEAEQQVRTATVTVIIPTRNRSHLVADAIRSVQAVGGPDLDLEIIVVDDGSTDNTRAVVQAMGVRYIQGPMLGAAAARNVGIRAATGEYLAFLDDDDVWLPAHLREHVRLLDAHPDYMGCIGQIVPTTPDLVPLAEPYPDSLPADGQVFETFLRQWPQLGAVVMRTVVRDKVGYLDEAESFDGGEDWDWLLRIARDYKIGHVRQPVVHFRGRPYANPHDDKMTVTRANVCRNIFWHNVWRARGRFPLSLPTLLRTALRFDGVYAGYFLRSAAVYASQGDRRNTIWSLARAARVSPLHLGWSVLRDGITQQAVTSIVTGRGPAL